MSRTKSMLALAAGAVLAGSAAQASVTPLPTLVFRNIPSNGPETGQPSPSATSNAVDVIQAGALTDDPSLSNFCTYDIQVVVVTPSSTQQDRWASGDLRAKLTTGMFYIPPDQDANFLQAAGTRNAVGARYLQVDTFVDVPSFNATRSAGSILGRSKFAPTTQTTEIFPSNGSNLLDPADPNGTAFVPANDMMLVDVGWGDVNAANQGSTANGTFTIARLTVKKGSTGTFIGRVGSLLDPNNPITFTYILGGGVIPEPTSVALMGLGLGAVALRRRK